MIDKDHELESGSLDPQARVDALEALSDRLKDVERHLDHHDALEEHTARLRRARARQIEDRLFGFGVGVYALIVVACLFPVQTARVIGRMASWRFDA